MKRATMLMVVTALTTAGVAGLIAASEPVETACDCQDASASATTPADGEQVVEVSGRSSEASESEDSSEANSDSELGESAPLRVAAQPAYDAQPIQVAGHQFASRAVFVGQG